MNTENKSIVFVDTYYPSFLQFNNFDKNSAKFSNYFDEINALQEFGFGTGGSYARSFRERGWQSDLIVANSLRTQAAWARENLDWEPLGSGWKYGLHLARLPFLRNKLHKWRHLHGVLLEQVRRIKPFAVVVQDLNLIPLSLAKELKKNCSVLVGEIASPPPPSHYFLGYDMIISALPSMLEYAQNLGLESHYVPLAFDERWSTKIPKVERDIDAIFVGSFSRHQPDTIPLLREVASKVQNFQIYGTGDLRAIEAAGLAQNYKGQAWGAEMFGLLSRSKIALNRHGTIAGDYSVNMRMYEATGSGALLVTEESSNLHTLFKPGFEVLSYKSHRDAARVIADSLNNPAELAQIAYQGHARTLREHTYSSRAELIENLILNFK